MKEFVVGLHAAAAAAGKLSKRAELMLELVMDIKVCSGFRVWGW